MRQAICAPPEDEFGQKPTILGGFSLVKDFSKKIENAGKGYARMQAKLKRAIQREQILNGKKIPAKELMDQDQSSDDDHASRIKVEKKSDEEEDEPIDEDAGKKYEKKRRQKTKEDIEREALLMEDLYGILGLEDKTFEASLIDIGKAYKKAALNYHPDKLGDKITEKDKEVWLKIQNAYETLIDPAKRKKYDSSLAFDDKIPAKEDIKSDDDFFTIFAKCFQNNARFSIVKPVPNIGDMDTPIKQVYEFYKFWDGFKSWREFSQYDEYDLEDAQDRYEKRWMEKENKKLREKYEKAERKRLFDLSNRAYECDPRIKAELEKEEAAKLAAKLAKKEAKASKQREIEEMNKKYEDEIKRKQQEKEDAILAEKVKEKDAAKLYRETVKNLIILTTSRMPNHQKYDKFFFQEFVKKVPKQEDLNIFLKSVQEVDKNTENNEIKFIEQFQILLNQQTGEFQAEKKKQEEQKRQEEEKKQEEAWSQEKGDWSQHDIQQLVLGIQKFPPGTNNRWKVIADFCGKPQKEAIAKAKEIQEKKELLVQQKRQAEEDQKKRHEEIKKEAQEKVKRELEQQKQKKNTTEVVDGWTSEQQKQMEKGMREIPASVATKERWIQIAEMVDGKTAKECFERFKQLVAKAKENQAAQ